MNVASFFIKCLEAHNTEYIFGVPGEENLDMLEAIKDSSIKLIITRNEQTAVFMAATYGRLTGKTGVAIATLGPGATNMMTGVAYAQLGGMPVMVITGQKPIKKSKQGRFQVLDVVGMMKPITKYSTSIVDGARVTSTIAHAILTAESEKPGAVHIELAEDIAGEPIEGQEPIVFEKVRRPILDEKGIANLIQKLEQAHRPMILVGAGANRKRVSKYLSKFIEKHNIPFFTSQMGKGVISESLPQYIGTAALTSGDHIHEVIDQSDLILSVGHDTIEKPTNLIEHGKTEVIHISYSPAEYDELYRPSLQLIGDIGNTFWQLYEADIDSDGRNFDGIYQTATEAKALLESHADSHFKSDVMMPGRLIKETRDILDDDAIVTLDNGLYKVRFARNFETYHPNTLLLDNALASMGAGYSSGMVAKMLNPEQDVVVFTGDGGLVMNLGDVETAVRLGNKLVIVVLNDNAYGMIKWKQKNMGYDDFGLDLHNPDFVKLAESFGALGLKVDDPKDYIAQMKKALDHDGVTVLDVKFAYPEKIE